MKGTESCVKPIRSYALRFVVAQFIARQVFASRSYRGAFSDSTPIVGGASCLAVRSSAIHYAFLYQLSFREISIYRGQFWKIAVMICNSQGSTYPHFPCGETSKDGDLKR